MNDFDLLIKTRQIVILESVKNSIVIPKNINSFVDGNSSKINNALPIEEIDFVGIETKLINEGVYHQQRGLILDFRQMRLDFIQLDCHQIQLYLKDTRVFSLNVHTI